MSGYSSRKALARAVGRYGYKPDNLKRWEDSNYAPVNEIDLDKLEVVARACGIPGFFSMDFGVDITTLNPPLEGEDGQAGAPARRDDLPPPPSSDSIDQATDEPESGEGDDPR